MEKSKAHLLSEERVMSSKGYDGYHKLPKDLRWLPSGGTGEIGGRATDVEQLGYSISHLIREHFPINQVPHSIVDALDNMELKLIEAHNSIDKVFELMNNSVLAEAEKWKK